MSLAQDNKIINPPIMINNDSGGVWTKLDDYVLGLTSTQYAPRNAYTYMSAAQIADSQVYGQALDVTAALQAWHDASSNNGGLLVLSAGSFLVGTLNITKPVTIIGAGNKATRIVAKNATGNVFNVTSDRVVIRDIGFINSVTRLSGAYVYVATTANQFHIQDFYMSGQYWGIQVDAAATVRIDNGSLRDGVAGGIGINFTGANPNANDYFLDSITMDASAGAMPAAGVQVQNCGALQASNLDIIHHTNDLLINPSSGQAASALYFINCFFDTATRGILVDPSGTGVVSRCHFIGCWTCSHTLQGVLINNGGTGARTGIHFTDHHCMFNGTTGFHVAAGNDIRILGGTFAQNNGNGIFFAANISQWSIIGARSGNAEGGTGNTQYGISIGSGAGNLYTILGCDLTSNTLGALNNGATGGTFVIAENLGYTLPPAALPAQTTAAIFPVPTSPVNYTAGTRDETIYINGGTVGLVKVNGEPVFQQTNCTIHLSAGATLYYDYTVTPGVARTIHSR